MCYNIICICYHICIIEVDTREITKATNAVFKFCFSKHQVMANCEAWEEDGSHGKK